MAPQPSWLRSPVEATIHQKRYHYQRTLNLADTFFICSPII